MKVRTIYTIDASPRVVWPLLCNSAMELRPSLCFLPGVPRPKACRLPSGVGGVGEPRDAFPTRAASNSASSNGESRGGYASR